MNSRVRNECEYVCGSELVIVEFMKGAQLYHPICPEFDFVFSHII